MGLFGSGSEYSKSDRGGFKDGTEFYTGTAKRVIDEEAEVVLYAVQVPESEGGGFGLTAVPLKDTALELDES